MLLNPRRTRTNMKLLQLVSFFLLTLSGQTAASSMQVKEDNDAILNCFLGTGNIKDEVFDWKKDKDKNKKEVFLYAKGSYYGHGQTGQDPDFEGRVFHFPDQLQFGNASIVIRKTKTSDSGTYTCHFPNHQPEIRSSISLTVDPILKPRPEIEGASPQPIITSDKTNDGVLLQCVVRGAFPKPEVEWWDSDGNILPADQPTITEKGRNKYDVILTYPVTKSGDYRCVATQKAINHQIYTKIYVPHPGAASKAFAKSIKTTTDGVLLQCEVFGASPELKVFWKDKAGKLVPSEEPQRTEKGGSYDIILQTTVTKTDYYRCVTTEGNVDDELFDETHVVVPVSDGMSIGSIIGIVLGVIGAVVVVFAVGFAAGCFLYHKKHRRGSAGDGTNRGNGYNTTPTDVEPHLVTSA